MPPFGKQDRTFSVHLPWHVMTFLSCGALDSKVSPLTGVMEPTEDRESSSYHCVEDERCGGHFESVSVSLKSSAHCGPGSYAMAAIES